VKQNFLEGCHPAFFYRVRLESFEGGGIRFLSGGYCFLHGGENVPRSARY